MPYSLFAEKKKTKAQLADRLRDGDEKAFKEVYHLFFKKLYAFCFSMTYSRETAEDIVQEVFVKLWVNRENINPALSLQAYLYTIARNQVYQHIRSASTEILAKQEACDHQALKSPLLSDEQMIYSELCHATKGILENMPMQRKLVYLLCKKYHLSYEEVARYLDISVNSVKTHMKLAIKTLREQLVPLLGVVLCYL